MRTVPLSECILPAKSKVQPKDYPGFPYIGLDDVESHTGQILTKKSTEEMKSAAVLFSPGEILYGRLRPYLNKVFVANEYGLCSAEFIPLKCKSEIVIPEYLAWLLRSNKFVSFSTRLGAGDRPRVSLDDIGFFLVPLYNTITQKKIVSKIDTLFAEIDAGMADLKRAKAQLELYKQSVLNAAIQGKLVPQDPNDEPASKLLERIRAEKEKLIKEGKIKKQKPLPPIDPSEVPFELPQGWEWVRLGELSQEFNYGTSQKCDYSISGTPVLRIPNIGNEVIDIGDLKFTRLEKNDYENLKLQIGDILIIRSNGSVNLVGRSAIVNDSSVGMAYAGYLIRLRPFQTVEPEYIHLCLSSFYLRTQIEAFAKSTSGVNNINAQELSRLIIPLPPTSEQIRVIKTVKKISEKKLGKSLGIELNLSFTSLLKQSILKSAFEGTLV